MRAPDFWRRDGVLARLLTPAAWLYRAGTALAWAWTRPLRVPVPVVCVGNLTLGGAGKTPVALALAEILLARGRRVHFLIRGYGGRARGPLRVDPDRHGADLVGDEALLLARLAPTWIGGDRRKSAAAAVAAGAGVLVMDDGFQNPSLVKDLSFVVIDLDGGFGNRRVFPAGPLREPIARGLGRADALVLIGGAEATAAPYSGGRLPVLTAHLSATESARALRGRRLAAFAGIGRPAKFFDTLEEIGARVVARHAFADHYRYRAEDIMALCEEADGLDAEPVTTEKDYVRLDAASKPMVRAVGVRLRFDDPARVEALLARALVPAGDPV
jgi:tetraacyldisaccharide 4'-kinase